MPRTIAIFWEVDLGSNMFLLSIPVSHEAKVPLLCSKNKRVCRNRESTYLNSYVLMIDFRVPAGYSGGVGYFPSLFTNRRGSISCSIPYQASSALVGIHLYCLWPPPPLIGYHNVAASVSSLCRI